MNHAELKEVVLGGLRRFAWRCGALVAALNMGSGAAWAANPHVYDVVIRNAMIYDGSGSKPFPGDVAIDADRIAYVGAPRALKGHSEIDAHGQANRREQRAHGRPQDALARGRSAGHCR